MTNYLTGLDLAGMTDQQTKEATARIAALLGVPVEKVILADIAGINFKAVLVSLISKAENLPDFVSKISRIQQFDADKFEAKVSEFSRAIQRLLDEASPEMRRQLEEELAPRLGMNVEQFRSLAGAPIDARVLTVSFLTQANDAAAFALSFISFQEMDVAAVFSGLTRFSQAIQDQAGEVTVPRIVDYLNSVLAETAKLTVEEFTAVIRGTATTEQSDKLKVALEKLAEKGLIETSEVPLLMADTTRLMAFLSQAVVLDTFNQSQGTDLTLADLQTPQAIFLALLGQAPNFAAVVNSLESLQNFNIAKLTQNQNALKSRTRNGAAAMTDAKTAQSAKDNLAAKFNLDTPATLDEALPNDAVPAVDILAANRTLSNLSASVSEYGFLPY
jgi:hypothetical protein